jgi:hypothetical protein
LIGELKDCHPWCGWAATGGSLVVPFEVDYDSVSVRGEQGYCCAECDDEFALDHVVFLLSRLLLRRSVPGSATTCIRGDLLWF